MLFINLLRKDNGWEQMHLFSAFVFSKGSNIFRNVNSMFIFVPYKVYRGLYTSEQSHVMVTYNYLIHLHLQEATQTLVPANQPATH